MRKSVFVMLAAALAPVSAFAVDGQVLINQSTVMAAGGFPYVISNPGSYKLSGNLTAPLNASGVVVSASNVTLDLNGFSVQCSSDGSVTFVSCIAGSAQALHDVVIRNGSVSASIVGSPGNFYGLSGVNFNAAGQGIPPSQVTLDGLQIRVVATFNDQLGANASWGQNSIIKGNVFTSSIPQAGLVFSCPSLIVQNVNAVGGTYNLSGSGCVVSTNVAIN